MKIHLIIFALFIMSVATAQDNRLIIDLSSSNYEQTIAVGTIDSLYIINKLAGEDVTYEFSVKKTRVAEQAFEFPAKSVSQLIGAKASGCEALIDLQKTFLEISNELEIAQGIRALKTAIKQAGDPCKEQKDNANQLIERTRELRGLAQAVKMLNDETLTVTIKRKKTATIPERFWEFEFHTPVTRWKVFFGFTYSPNLFSPEKTFYAKSNPDTTTFTISPGRRENGRDTYKNLTPTVMFTYFFTKKDHDVKFAGTGGVSLDLSNPSAMLGPSAVIGENLSINAGIIMRQKERLLLKYQEGSEIGEDLGFDQLHEKVWKPEFFFSIGFRFNRNPFSESEAKEK